MKRLVFCFDGTSSRLIVENPTNVVLTAESVLPLANDQKTAQLIFYDEGVGTTKGDKLAGILFGRGLDKNLADAYRFLIFNYTPGDQIYIFGFSRGAYTARSFAGLLAHSSIPNRRHADEFDKAIDLYRERNNNTPEFIERMMEFRRKYCWDVCVSDKEDAWRAAKDPSYMRGTARLLGITYIGVWDTVGALGVPGDFFISRWMNRKYRFHNTELSGFARSGRHALAIDEHRRSFAPTLWTNLAELNAAAGTSIESDAALYQQKWFPGTHSSVGGGGEGNRHGLSDQALHWVWVGAMRMGLELDTSEQSRIFGLKPDYTEYIADTDEPGVATRLMINFGTDRLPGPQHLYEVHRSALKRWHENSKYLQDQKSYRPKTLMSLEKEIDDLKPEELGVGDAVRENQSREPCKMYRVKPNENLTKLAQRFYGSATHLDRIVKANPLIDDINVIFAGDVLRIPTGGLVPDAFPSS
jgi:uncharacterized protein (DUF2235 family)